MASTASQHVTYTDVVNTMNDSLPTVNISSQLTNYSIHPDITVATTTTYARVVEHYILPLLCCFGIIGIIVTLLVLTRRRMRGTTNCYLVGLTLADLFFLILLCTRLMDKWFTPNSHAHQHYQIMATYGAVLMDVFLMVSIWITVLLAIERHHAISDPFEDVPVSTVKRVRLLIAGTYLVCFLVRLPHMFLYKVESVEDRSTGVRHTYIVATDLADNAQYNIIYPILADVLLMSVIPFTALLVLNTLLYMQLRLSSDRISRNMQQKLPVPVAKLKENAKILVMLIAMIIVVFCCQAPYVIYVALINTNGMHKLNLRFLTEWRYSAMMLLTFKSAVNFIIYCCGSEKFRYTLNKMISAHCPAWVRCTQYVRNKGSGNADRKMSSSRYVCLRRPYNSSGGNTRASDV